MSGYGALAAFYDDLADGIDRKLRSDRYWALFCRFGDEPATVLDLACGSLGISMQWMERGAEIIGVDASEDMLAIAADKSAGRGEPMLLCQDMCGLDLYGTVDGAVCAMDGLNHLCTTAQLDRALSRLHLFIKPGGLFVFDMNTPYKHRFVLGNESFVFETDDVFCVWRNDYRESSCEVRMHLDFFIRSGDVYRRMYDDVRERAYSLRTLRSLLAKNGFELLAIYDDLNDTPPHNESERWVMVARRT